MWSYHPDRDRELVSTNHTQDQDRCQKFLLVLSCLTLNGNVPPNEYTHMHSSLVTLAGQAKENFPQLVIVPFDLSHIWVLSVQREINLIIQCDYLQHTLPLFFSLNVCPRVFLFESPGRWESGELLGTVL